MAALAGIKSNILLSAGRVRQVAVGCRYFNMAYVCVYVRTYVRTCERACVRAYVRACIRVCVCVCVSVCECV